MGRPSLPSAASSRNRPNRIRVAWRRDNRTFDRYRSLPLRTFFDRHDSALRSLRLLRETLTRSPAGRSETGAETCSAWAGDRTDELTLVHDALMNYCGWLTANYELRLGGNRPDRRYAIWGSKRLPERDIFNQD